MESRKAVSNFKSCCKALVDTIPPGHRLTDAQELIVLSNLQVVESAIQVSHLQQHIAVYNPNASGPEHNPLLYEKLEDGSPGAVDVFLHDTLGVLPLLSRQRSYRPLDACRFAEVCQG